MLKFKRKTIMVIYNRKVFETRSTKVANAMLVYLALGLASEYALTYIFNTEQYIIDCSKYSHNEEILSQ